jgi:hypothetical protein
MQKIKINVFPLVLSILIVIISLLTYNFAVTFDGYLYLNSAHYLFKENFILEYQWLREPGYPFLLKIIEIISPIDILYVFFQSLMTSISFFLFYHIFFANRKISVFSKLFILFIILNPYFLTWNSIILQVAPITLCLALISFMISKNHSNITKNDHIYWIIVNTFCLTIALQIGLISLFCNLIILVKYAFSQRFMLKEIIISLLIFFVISTTWLSYKNHVMESTKEIQSGWNVNYSSGSQLILPIDWNILPTAFNHSMSLTGINNLGNRETESYGLVNSVFNGGNTCGVWFPTDYAYSANFIQNLIQTRCSSNYFNSLLSKFNYVGSVFWQISSLFMWLSLIWFVLMLKTNRAFIVMPAFLLLISYSFLIFSIDRYILPTYIVGLFMFVTFIEFTLKKTSNFLKDVLT